MGDQLVLCVERLITPQSLESIQGTESLGSSLGSNEVPTCVINVEGVEEHYGPEDEEEPLIRTAECRICQEEDTLKNLEVPCACSGSLKPYQPGYTAPTPYPYFEDTTIDMRQGWTISGAPLDLRDHQLLAVAVAERHFLDAEYDEEADNNAGGAALCRSTALILIALLFLRHALGLPVSDTEHGASAFFTVLFIRACSFLFPCYVMAWAITILQHRRQRQEAADFMVQAGRRRAMQFTITPGPAMIPTQ
ncbi:Zinc finger, RING/FYVE/PHD-type [Parasponia andersonii]|uniref:Zinc finger, RING/FYVE/PHD-type n=1 Tax=Parasponia andersonii TaxID=3476 RepID=A0A2P5C8R8_PARAD|nr:Zinc finger, RING/FYVE/PHD-type [Parasponia andersonii]